MTVQLAECGVANHGAPMTPAFLDEDAVDFALTEACRLGADAAEAGVAVSESLSVDVRMQSLESVEHEESRALSVRVFFGQRQAGATTSNLTRSALAELVERVASAARHAPENPFEGLLPPPGNLAASNADLELYDPSGVSPADLEGLALTAEQCGLEVEGVCNSAGASASWSRGAFSYRNSNGYAGASQGSSYALGLSLLAERNSVKERDYEGHAARWRADLRAAKDIGRAAGERAVARLGARKLESCKAPVIFEARIAGRLLSPLLGAIAGPAIARGISFLRDALGTSVFPSGFTLLNDPLRPRGASSRSFDGEGMPTKARNLIENGVLSGWLLNASSARQLGLQPSGDATFGSGGAPGVGATNLRVSPGSRNLRELMADAQVGLLVTETFSPSLNPNSGDYSVGIAGFWFEDGAPAFPVHEVTIAGNLRDFYGRVVAGNDLELRGSLEAPSLLVDDVVIAGR